ncbi:hypothetical protein J4437_04860 [Candidatus Woesearchaeota archaeon]|nr:hypothetical protein [Candidatus Woesearchaeota archaeon]
MNLSVIKKNVTLVKFICILLLIISFSLIFFNSFELDLEKLSIKSNCCQECSDKADQDPSGYDISIKECSNYKLSSNCEKYFTESKLRVGQCS